MRLHPGAERESPSAAAHAAGEGIREQANIPALAFRVLTPLYDPILRLTLREGTFRSCLVQQMDVRVGHQVLDLGCGTGSLTLRIKDAVPGAAVMGLDPDPVVLALAKDKAQRAGLEVSFDRGDAASTPYPDGTFDRVASSLVFHHLDPRLKRLAAAEAYRVLRVGGELHVADWGKPQNALMRVAFVGIQLLDGFASTAENVSGALPGIFRKAGFDDVRERARFATVFGTLTLYSAWRGGADPRLPRPEGQP